MKGQLKTISLFLISEKKRTGYDLISELEQYSGKRPSTGTIYPMLDKLEKEGNVIKVTNGRRNYFTLTKKGENLLKNLLTRFYDKLEMMINFSHRVNNKRLGIENAN